MTCTVTGWPTVSTSAGRDAALEADLRRGQQPFDAADVDERAEVLERGDHAGQHRAHDQLAARLGGAAPRLLLEQRAARQHDVGAAAIVLVARDPELEPLPT